MRYLINETDYTRFLKKNPHLTPDQIKKINDFYNGRGKQHVKDFELEIGWQSKRVREITWEDFVEIIKKSKAGQRELLQSTEIPGSKRKDYWPIRLKTKDYIANIPLNFKTAHYMNSCKYGTINVNYCIGNDEFGAIYWEKHMLKGQKVPIYITNGKGKWVVVILPDNESYEIWDKLNNKNVALTNKEPIPDFSIQKELLYGGLKKLYDELREKYFAFNHWIKNAKIKDALYEIYGDGYVIWKNGIWEGGTWEGGTWEGGKWKDGIWEKGTWEYGTWKDGVWKKGVWEWGIWEKGIWKKGVWEDGTWKKGTWKKGRWGDGIWEDGTWENGIWEDGTWENGIWENGKWEGGTWLKGTWLGGKWLGGYDKYGNYHPEGDSPDKWNI